ncbi:chemotaxis protein CheX [Pseudodesulfovibrio portus]|uniref:Chemotaxis protein CheX n=1 Tax=Pseudodesulfovibrio portus TaxID=231439 RepID=A0ABM8AMK9_9BACT|nr:chemotaxis protein CheX [Pseudodesulfovibrio portus]BDQ32633.1 chemotaxis protein CheX [Pseudodesulfovibrio portus]
MGKINYNVNFINPFLQAVIHVLQTMAHVQANPEQPYLNEERKAIGDVTGIIGITGYSKGTMSITLEKDVILKIVNNMLFEEYSEINEEICDAVGELTNMISGQARAKLSQQGQSFDASTPTIFSGRGIEIKHVASAPVLSIPFTTDEGRFVVEVAFESS